jgi:hypothetical protein
VLGATRIMIRLACCFLVATSALAHADPVPEPTRYLELEGSLGFLPAGAGFDVGVSLGLRRSEHGWLRFAISGGSVQRYIDGGPPGPLVEARVGYEGRGCTAGGILCGYVGIDGALFFARNPDPDTDIKSSFIGLFAIPRVGMDIGGRALRLRLGIEAGVGPIETVAGPPRSDAAFAFALTAGLAYRW